LKYINREFWIPNESAKKDLTISQSAIIEIKQLIII
jgi:hypothetical protein